MEYETKTLPKRPSYIAPDGSEIRKLADVRGGGLAHCTLPRRSKTQAITHQTVDEIWCVIGGEGEVWRKLGKQDEVVRVKPGTCLTIPVGTHFQFVNTGSDPLRFIIATIPPWPGPHEAVNVKGHWKSA